MAVVKQGWQRLLEGFLSLLDAIFGGLQRWIGPERMPYVFVLPNLLIFGIFILAPMLLNFVYAFTGGADFFPTDRAFVGTDNFTRLLSCENYLQPNSCREDLFWRAVFNTTGYVVVQVVLLVGVSLITAVILNRRIKARAFFRSVFFYPVLLSPIVVALIWKWILQENGLLNCLNIIVVSDHGGQQLEPQLPGNLWVNATGLNMTGIQFFSGPVGRLQKDGTGYCCN